MNYVKKMCILRQIKQGFSGDGKTLSGLIKIEQYGKNLAVEVSIINFAPLSIGEYYCLLSDGKGKTEMLALRGKSFFNILSDLDISNGFCGVICYVKTEIVPIAYGINGNGSYDWKRILNAALPPVFPTLSEENAFAAPAPTPAPTPVEKDMSTEKPQDLPLPECETPPPPLPDQKKSAPASPCETKGDKGGKIVYDDDTVASENYYEEKENEQIQPSQALENAQSKNAGEKQAPQKGSNLSPYADAARVLHPFAMDSDGYYVAVKGEIDGLFKKYPRDKTLEDAFACSEWVRVKGSMKAPEYLVGVVYENGKARYICYALAAKEGSTPPEEIRNVCSFVPVSVYKEQEGFFVIFQSAATGECIKPVLA